MKKTIIVVFVLYFFQGLLHNLGHPITPDFVKDLEMTNMFGVFFALMSLGLALGGPFWGILGDRLSKRVLILIGLLIYSIGQYVFGNVHNIYVMSIFRFVSGFGVSASVTLLMSYLIEQSDFENKTRNIAWGAAMMALGASTGYFIGGKLPGLLPETDSLLVFAEQAKTVFLIQAILNAIFAVTVFFSLKSDQEREANEKTSMIESIKSIRYLDKNLIVFLISLTLISMAAINLSKFTEVYIASLGYGSEGIGNFVAVTGIVGILTTIFVVPLVIKLRKDIYVMLVVNLLSAIIIFIVFRMSNIMLGLYTLFMLYMVMKSVFAPLETSYISSHSNKNEYGKIMGIRQFFFAIGFVIGPLVGGSLNNINPLYVFDLSAILFLTGFVLILLVKNNLKKEKLSNISK